MTFEQLTIFVAVAEREHLTRAAEALHLTPSAVSAAIKALETYARLRLFERVGRGLELTTEGRLFLNEARATLARMRETEIILSDLAGLRRGQIRIHASQTIANYWLPSRLLGFRQLHPGIQLDLVVGNTRSVTDAVLSGEAEMGFIEGVIDEPRLVIDKVADDHLVIVAATTNPLADSDTTMDDILRDGSWVLREKGSGTRSELEAALARRQIDPAGIEIVMTLPSNEAVISAVLASHCITALSRAVATPFCLTGQLAILPVQLPPRAFMALHHRERHVSAAAREFLALCQE